MFRRLYLSNLGYIISVVLNILSLMHKPFMVYGYYNRKSKSFRKNTRISSSAKLINKSSLEISDNVWIGHYCLVDSIGGVNISEGVNISSHTVIYSHSSHDSLRLLGSKYIRIKAANRPGYILESVFIGAYTFIGTSSIILPGVSIGKGCIVGAGSVVNNDIPDFSIAVGNPIRIIGDTRTRDKEMFSDIIKDKNYYLNKK